MGRHRKVERDVLLDAAQQVVVDRGAAHLTLDAVASDAGVSKASVLYGYKSKDVLVHSLVTHKLEAAKARVEQAKESLEDPTDSGIRARIAITAKQRLSIDDRSVALAVISAMAGNLALRDAGRAFFKDAVDDVLGTATSRKGAMLAFLALEGLRKLDYLDVYRWSRDEYEAILEDIAWLAGQEPSDPHSASDNCPEFDPAVTPRAAARSFTPS